jgi:hypothetical protein
MFEMIAFGFKDIVVLVLDLPARSSRLHNCFHTGAIQVVQCRERIAIQDGTSGLFGDGEFTPVDP